MVVGQRVQSVARHLAGQLMRGTIPQSEAEIKVTVIVTIKDADCTMDFSASAVLVDEADAENARNLSILVAE